jgi:hypothetical protein
MDDIYKCTFTDLEKEKPECFTIKMENVLSTEEVID